MSGFVTSAEHCEFLGQVEGAMLLDSPLLVKFRWQEETTAVGGRQLWPQTLSG